MCLSEVTQRELLEIIEVMKNEFVLAFNQVLEEKQLPKQVIVEALEAAMATAYRKSIGLGDMQYVQARVSETGEVVILSEKEVVEIVQDERTEVSFEEAKLIDKDVILGSVVVIETIPKEKDFGRVAAQNARNVIQQRIRDAEKKIQIEYFEKQVGEIISGTIQSINNGNVTIVLEKGAEGSLSRKEQIPGERFRVTERIRVLLIEIKSAQKGYQISLSRAHKNFLRRLLEIEVPEIFHGIVEIRSIAREPGYRSKVAVAALKPGIDPVGACVGIRGVRIQAIVRELHDEKIDVIEWNPDPRVYIAKTLSPARVFGVYLDEFARGPKTATVVVPEDQLSLAIGKDGQNARLSAKLTGWRIDIKGQLEATSDILYKLQNMPDYMQVSHQVEEFIPQIEAVLTKKEEGRPVTPEEYQLLNRFIDQIETSVINKHQEARKTKESTVTVSLAPEYLKRSIEELKLNERVQESLAENGYSNLGELIQQIEIDADAILKLNGIGPKAMADITSRLEALMNPVIEAAEPASTVEVEVQLVETPLLEEVPLVEEIQPEESESTPVMEQKDDEASSLPTSSDSSLVLSEQEEAEEMIDSDEKWKEEDDDEEEDEDDEDFKNIDKKKKKKKFVEMEFDPDKGVMIVKRKRKRIEEWESSDW